MSTCIALACKYSKSSDKEKLVLIMDKMVSLGGTTSLETGLKGKQIGEHWHCVFAGNDVSHVGSVMDLANEYIDENEEEQSLVKVRDCFTRAYHNVRKKQIEEQLL